MTETVCLFGGPVFDGERLRADRALVFNADGILEIRSAGKQLPAGRQIDVRGRLVAPGLVDLHCDAIEKCIEIRPNVFFETDFAISHLDQRLAACGITTFCHAISFSDYEIGLRTPQAAADLAAQIKRFASSGNPFVRHRVHARCEVHSPKSMALIRDLIDAGLVDLLSIMDHTPGQGQFKTLASYVDYCAQVYRTSEAEILDSLEKRKADQPLLRQGLAALTAHAKTHKIPIVSHDDDTRAKVALVHSLHAGGCEFPITLEAAKEAKVRGMRIFMGAPNLLRNASSNGNLKASSAIEADLCTGLVSDYVPESLMHVPFVIHRLLGHDLAYGLRRVTRHPAEFLGATPSDGRLAPGSAADIVVMDLKPPWQRVRQTWVGGRQVYAAPL
jgi:alpha-D-ribose 1-methylphosphonate 5-triphosphate diphosphatase